jgi:hypothetical protein
MDGDRIVPRDSKYYEVATPGSLSERLMTYARDRMYADFIAHCAPSETTSLLDVGVSDVLNGGANMLERLYPYRRRITACGLGEAKEFQAEFPDVRYVKVSDGGRLPFGNHEFDLATANAVLEHVGGVERQRRFVAEMCRVAKRVFITVPNRFFPVEHHTGIPLLHWSDASFRFACALLGKSAWAREEELRLMSRGRLAATLPSGCASRLGYTGLSFGPFSSNLFADIRPSF